MTCSLSTSTGNYARNWSLTIKQMVYVQPRICPTKWNAQTPPNLGPTTRPYNNQQEKKRTCRIVDFAVPADYTVKLKECKRRDKFLNLLRELKNLWNMKVPIVSIVICAHGTVSKGLVQGLEDLKITRQVETAQTIALLRSTRILRRVLENWGDLLSLKIQWKSISACWGEKLSRCKIIIIIIIIMK